MSPRHNAQKIASLAVSEAASNFASLDEATHVPLGSGISGRYGRCPISALIQNPNRVQAHPTRQLNKLQRSIAVSGHLAPVVVDDGYVILAGHGRCEVANRTGDLTVPVVQVFGLSSAQKRHFLLADNRIGVDSKLDRKALADQLPELTFLFEDAGFDLTDTGYEVADLDDLVLDFGDEAVDPDDVVGPEILDEATTLQAGDLWALGEHRLIVGDARDEATLDRLMNGEQAEAAFLDVPYNLRAKDIGGRGRKRHPEFAFASGEMSRTDYVTFLYAALGNAARISIQGAVHFVCIDWKHVRDLIEAGDRVYDDFLNLVAWVKTNAGNGGLYRSQHELVGVFRVGPVPHRDNVQKGRFGRNRSNVWTYAGANTFRKGRLEDLADHPTVKPTALVADALKDVTRQGGIVLDSFVGSGTTILAGERVGRKVRAAEIAPYYAQVAVRRWEATTGRQAIHVESGLAFDALVQQRDGTENSNSATTEGGNSIEPASTSQPAPRVRKRSRSTG